MCIVTFISFSQIYFGNEVILLTAVGTDQIRSVFVCVGLFVCGEGRDLLPIEGSEVYRHA